MKEPKWDNDLLQGLSKAMKPQLSDEYHSEKNIVAGRNCPARIIKETVKELLSILPAETFIGKEQADLLKKEVRK